MRGVHAVPILAVAVAIAGCGSSGTKLSSPAGSTTKTSLPPKASPALSKAAANYHPKINPANFSDHVTNPYMPLTPGTTHVLVGLRGGAATRPPGPVVPWAQVVRPRDRRGAHDKGWRRPHRDQPYRQVMDSSSTDGKATEVEAPLMEARDLFHIYRETEVETVALRGANLDLRPGSWTSLMGPSGSGKSTLVHVLAGLLEPNGGSVMFHHPDVTRLSAAERTRLRRTRIGLVLQRDNLHPLLDIAGNVALPLRLDGRGAGEARERVEELLDAVGLLDWQRHAAAELSGGEAQRVALAVAFAPRPPVPPADG